MQVDLDKDELVTLIQQYAVNVSLLDPKQETAAYDTHLLICRMFALASQLFQ